MKTRIENETVKPAGITYPALFKNRYTGTVWLQANEMGDCMAITGESVGKYHDHSPSQDTPEMYTHIPGPLTITFNSDKE